MFYIAIILSATAAVFYAASINSSGWAMQICSYSDMFCARPSLLLIAALLSLIWACLVRVDRL